ncbi:MAG: RidA family protein [Rhodospirillaceae bacterium]|jgi:enamine deaminase RidA (YjgF/YER057c/UK114 family)
MVEYINPGSWNSRAVIHNGVAYLSGIVADDKTLSMEGQTSQVLEKIDRALAEAGTDKTRILSAVVYLSDMDLKDDMNKSWMAWMNSEHPPARAAVGVTLTPGTLVEIMVQAAV